MVTLFFNFNEIATLTREVYGQSLLSYQIQDSYMLVFHMIKDAFTAHKNIYKSTLVSENSKKVRVIRTRVSLPKKYNNIIVVIICEYTHLAQK